jgi:hypothetical protein
MAKFPLCLTLLLVYAFAACKKGTGSSGDNSLGYQISIVSGDHQTDTVGEGPWRYPYFRSD